MPNKLQALVWGLKAVWLFFIFAYGACLGSLTNVVVYRLPRGESIIRPPSKCPNCGTKLSWRDNIPVFGWLALRGKCRYCKNPISPEYPIVEAAFGLLFVAFYIIWYMLPPHAVFLGIDWGAIRPAWSARNDAMQTWPEFVAVLLLLASLFAMTIVDAKTFTIPIWLAWFPALVGLVFNGLHGVWASVSSGPKLRAQIGWDWFLPTPGVARWDLVGLSVGGMIGLGIGLLLLRFGLVSRSFADFAEWEDQAKKAEEEAAAKKAAEAPPQPAPVPEPPATPETATGMLGALLAWFRSLFQREPDETPEVWMTYPHARREVIRELSFLGPCILLMLVGWYAGRRFGGVTLNPWNGAYTANWPVWTWLQVLSGVFMGYLIGGGIVWGVRIFGSLAFGKEAMGMGDVHLMGAVGACLGWIDATLGFFGAAFVGLAWAILGRLLGGRFQKMLPYGPFLAVSTVLVMVCKPLVERGLAALTHSPIHLPP